MSTCHSCWKFRVPMVLYSLMCPPPSRSLYDPCRLSASGWARARGADILLLILVIHYHLPYNNIVHRSLNNISQSIRFLVNGVLGQVIFMTGYNISASTFEPMGYPASTIYAVFYLCYIPVGHALQCLFVFGWPKEYVPSLMSNAPIGLSAMAIGTMLTGFLSRVEFNSRAEDWITSTLGTEPKDEEEGGEFYSTLVVMIATCVVLCFELVCQCR